MTSAIQRALLRQCSVRGKFADGPKWQRILRGAHPKQRAFVSHLAIAIALAGRGGGKSYGMGMRYHRPSDAHPMQSSVFVAMSAERARDILMPALYDLNARHNLGLREYKKANAVIWPNGYRVLMRGCKDRNEANKRRGTPWVVAGWDECDAIESKLLEYDIHECVEPRLADFGLPWFAGGTPGALQTGYWHHLTSGKNKNYRVFTWDARDNPAIPNAVEYFLGALRRMIGADPNEDLYTALVRELCPDGVAPDGVEQATDFLVEAFHHLLPPKFVREYLGKWAKDVAALVYYMARARSFSGPPPIKVERTTIGLDLGGASPESPHLDHCAWTVAQSTSLSPKVYIRESSKDSDMTPTTLGVKCLQIIDRYERVDGECEVYIDNASAGQLILNQFRKMGIPVHPAVKGPKKPRIQLVQDGIKRGDIEFSYAGTATLREEASVLVWDDRMKDHHPKCADDAWDSCLYAVIPHLDDYEPEHEPPQPGTREWAAMEEEREFQEALDEADQNYHDACSDIDAMGI